MKFAKIILGFMLLAVLVSSASALTLADGQWVGGGQAITITDKESATLEVSFTTYDAPMDMSVELYKGNEFVKTLFDSLTESQFFQDSYKIEGLPVGNYEVRLKSSDNSGDIDVYVLSLTVNTEPADGGETPGSNEAPKIKSLPVKSVEEGKRYVYNVVATDDDEDSLSYKIFYSVFGHTPSWISISDAGQISGIAPMVDSDTEVEVAFVVFDGKGGSVMQKYDLTIKNVAGDDGGDNGNGETPRRNTWPEIISTPVKSVDEGKRYSYQVIATDADNDVLNYLLVSGSPAWLSVDSETGLVTGVAPSVSRDVTFNVGVAVTDESETRWQEFQITVRDDDSKKSKDSGINGVKTLDDDFYNEKYLEQFNPIRLDEDLDSSDAEEESSLAKKIVIAFVVLVFLLIVLVLIYLLRMI